MGVRYSLLTMPVMDQKAGAKAVLAIIAAQTSLTDVVDRTSYIYS
jgi:hypothetical protein